MQRKKSLRALDSFANWTQKGGGIQGISAASAARAETLSDALGTRLDLGLPIKLLVIINVIYLLNGYPVRTENYYMPFDQYEGRTSFLAI